MLDIKFIRENTGLVLEALQKRNLKIDLEELLGLDNHWRRQLRELEELRSQRNKANDQISLLLKQKQNPKELIVSLKELSSRIDELEKEVRAIEARIENILLTIPNVPHSSVPVGDESKKEIVHAKGQLRKFDFPVLTHMEIAQHLDLIDFGRAAKITGANFVLYKGWGARLERALINFMLDLHTQKHGYLEVFPPFLVNRASMLGTGQLPKLEEDMYRLKDDDLFLIPTAEVPVTNIFRGEILEEEQLPIYLTAYSACFRREAGSYGKDTKGLVRVHQFDKVELVKFVHPQTSYEELEKLVRNAEEVLELLELPYRRVVLPTQDLSFSAAKCYDLEAYAPGLDKWLEVSSCSNFEAFQARRANIRFRQKETKRLEYVHTLNGSGVALARTMIAILENYQQKDGCVVIPQVLRPYLNGKERIP